MAELNWNILDPNAPQKAANAFAQGRQNMLATQDAEQQRQMNALAIQNRQQQMADEQAIRNAYAQSGGDRGKLVDALKGAGQYKQAMDVQGQLTADQAAAQKAKVEEGLKHIQVLGQLASGVTDQNSYDAAKQQLAQLYGPESVANMPAQYDPVRVKQFVTQAMTIKDNLDQQWKQLDYGLKQQQFGFEKQKFGQEQAQRANQFAQTQALEREKMKATQEAKAGTPAQRIQDAQDAITILNQAAPLIDKATASGIGTAADVTAGFFGKSTEGADAAAQLKVLGGALVSKMPKMSGPQSDKDVLLYKEMAGRIGDPTVPRSQKKAAMQTIMDLQSKYAGTESKSLDFGGGGSIPSGWSVQEH